MKPVLYLMLGYPGAGKTTTAKVIAQITGAEHLWADQERRRKFDVPSYTHGENLKLYKELNLFADKMLAEGKSVIFDTNFNFHKDREHLREIATRHGADTKLIWVTTPKDIARNRATKNAHLQKTRVLGNMPAHSFERMSNNLQPPQNNEKYIRVDGTKVSEAYIRSLLAE